MNWKFGFFPFLTLAGCTLSPNPAASETDWIELFNGEDLSGWSVRCLEKDRGKPFWKVDRGTILCDSIGNPDHGYVWLMTDREFSDFELELQFQAFRDSPGNSGVQVRSRYDSGPDAPGGGWLDGPQVDIHPPEPWRTGMIYDETREERRWIHPSLPDWNIDESFAPEQWIFRYAEEEEGWNLLEITCRGPQIRVALNGRLTTDYDGTGVLDNEAHRRHRVGLHGYIALQLHVGDELKIRFRDIRIRTF